MKAQPVDVRPRLGDLTVARIWSQDCSRLLPSHMDAHGSFECDPTAPASATGRFDGDGGPSTPSTCSARRSRSCTWAPPPSAARDFSPPALGAGAPSSGSLHALHPSRAFAPGGVELLLPHVSTSLRVSSPRAALRSVDAVDEVCDSHRTLCTDPHLLHALLHLAACHAACQPVTCMLCTHGAVAGCPLDGRRSHG